MDRKNKNILLVAGFLLGLFCCYQFAIAKSFTLKNEYDELKQEAIISQDLPHRFKLLNRRKSYYDSILTKYQLNESSVQHNLLETINAFAEKNNLQLVDFKEPHSYRQNDLLLKTYRFTLEGDYNAILQLIYNLEQKRKFGEIINLHFEKKENYRTGEFYLQASVLLRSFG